jgi:hypothetical protein
LRGLDRPHPASDLTATAAPRGAFAAIAAVAALLLSLAVLATTPRAGLTALGGARIAFLSDTDRSAETRVEHPSQLRVAGRPARVAPTCARAALAVRAAVMVRHTSLPPPART